MRHLMEWLGEDESALLSIVVSWSSCLEDLTLSPDLNFKNFLLYHRILFFSKALYLKILEHIEKFKEKYNEYLVYLPSELNN